METGAAMARAGRPIQIPEGTHSVADVERRLLTACRTLRALPDPTRKYQTHHNMWPEVVQEIADAYGYTEASLPRFKPSPAQVSDCLDALELARVLTHEDFRLVWWRSFGLSFRAIGMRLHRSDERARQLYRDCILRVWYSAAYAN